MTRASDLASNDWFWNHNCGWESIIIMLNRINLSIIWWIYGQTFSTFRYIRVLRGKQNSSIFKLLRIYYFWLENFEIHRGSCGVFDAVCIAKQAAYLGTTSFWLIACMLMVYDCSDDPKVGKPLLPWWHRRICSSPFLIPEIWLMSTGSCVL